MSETRLLRVEELTVRYGGLAAVDRVSLDVEEGSIVGLIGPNGAGKTSFIDALTGFTPSVGSIRFDGEPVETLPPHQRARRGIVRTFQSLELFDDLSIRENLAVAADRPHWWTTFVDALHPRRGRDDDVEWALEAVGLAGFGDRLPTELANGPRHMVALARALVSRPRLALLDEPAAGLDTSETAELAERLRALPGLGVSVLLVDHDMGLVLGVCDTVSVLDFGAVITSGPPAAVRADPDVIRAYLGTGSGSGSATA
ncbi:MAG: ABC transporter ATP-binding protein [Acidimicrobiia bacterium]